MLSLVRGEALSVEGADLEQLIKKHDEYRLQIDRQLSKSQAVRDEGRRLRWEGNFMSQEVRTFNPNADILNAIASISSSRCPSR